MGWKIEYWDGSSWVELEGAVEKIDQELNGHEEFIFSIPNTSSNRDLVSSDKRVRVSYNGSVLFDGLLTGAEYQEGLLKCYVYPEAYVKMNKKIIPSGSNHAVEYISTSADSILEDICTEAGVTKGQCPTTQVSLRFIRSNCLKAAQALAEMCNADFWADYDDSGNPRFNIGTRQKQTDVSVTPISWPSRGIDRSRKYTKVIVRGVDANGNYIEGSAGTGDAVIVFTEKKASDQDTLNNIAAKKLEELNTEASGVTLPLKLSEGYSLEPGDTVSLNKPELDLSGSYKILRVVKKLASVEIEIERKKTAVDRSINQLKEYEEYGIYPISAEQFKSGIKVAAYNASDKSGARYVCDGVDDQEEINEALSLGIPVYLTDGTFNVSSSIVINKSGAGLIGQGTKTRIEASMDAPIIKVQRPSGDVNNNVIKDLVLKGPGSSYTNAHGIKCEEDVWNIEIENVAIGDCRHAIDMTETHWFTIKRVNIQPVSEMNLGACYKGIVARPKSGGNGSLGWLEEVWVGHTESHAYDIEKPNAFMMHKIQALEPSGKGLYIHGGSAGNSVFREVQLDCCHSDALHVKGVSGTEVVDLQFDNLWVKTSEEDGYKAIRIEYAQRVQFNNVNGQARQGAVLIDHCWWIQFQNLHVICHWGSSEPSTKSDGIIINNSNQIKLSNVDVDTMYSPINKTGISGTGNSGIWLHEVTVEGFQTAYSIEGAVWISEDGIIRSDSVLAESLKKGIQPFNSDIEFSPDDSDPHGTLTWTAGTIRFADGSTHSINAGSYTLPSDGYLCYAIFLLSDNDMHFVANYSDAVGDDRGILAIVYRSTDPDQELLIQPFYSKGLNIQADAIAAKSITTQHLAAGAVTTEKLHANAVTAEKVAARAITVEKLMVGGATNELSDGGFEQGDLSEWGTCSSVSVKGDAKRTGNYGLELNQYGYIYSLYLPISQGSEYHAEVYVKSKTGASSGYVRLSIYWYNAGKEYISSDSVLKYYDDLSDWTLLSVDSTAPADAVYTRVRIYCSVDTGAYADDVLFRGKITGDLVVNGTLKTKHIRFDSLTSDPTYEAGKLWWRNDLDQLRFASGTTLDDVAIIPKYPLTDTSAPPENLVPNQSFEIDRDCDGVPDYWSSVIYSGSPTFGRISSTSVKGAYAVYIGLSDAGEGKFRSAFIPIKPGKYYIRLNAKGSKGKTHEHSILHLEVFDKDKEYNTSKYVEVNPPDSWKTTYTDWHMYDWAWECPETMTAADGVSTFKPRYVRITLRNYGSSTTYESIYYDDVVFSEMRAAKPTDRVVGLTASYELDNKAVYDNSWTTIQTFTVGSSSDVEIYFVECFVRNATTLGSQPSTPEVALRIYDNTDSKSYPSSIGLRAKFDWTTHTHYTFFVTIPKNVAGHELKVQMNQWTGSTRYFDVYFRAWGHSLHYHR